MQKSTPTPSTTPTNAERRPGPSVAMYRTTRFVDSSGRSHHADPPRSPKSRPGQICVIGGAGYVGLTTALGFAETGRRVVAVDIDEGRVAQLNRGVSPIYERGIEEMLRRNLDTGRLSFAIDPVDAIAQSDTIFIAVGTPASANGRPDLSQVICVSETIARHLRGYTVVAIRSTVPTGTTATVREILGQDHDEGVDFDLVVNPEFLREGNALEDFFYPDRLVFGTSSKFAGEWMRELYRPIISGENRWNEGKQDRELRPTPLIETNLTDAELIKHAANAFLATRVSFINEVAAICERVGADIDQVKAGLSQDPRIGESHLNPGLGFGGPCLEKDLTALVTIAEDAGVDPVVMRAVLDRNERQVVSVLSKVRGLLGPSLHGRPIAILGVAFKAHTNDVRNSLALRIAHALENDGAAVRVYDPMGMPQARNELHQTVFCSDVYEAVKGTQAILVLTEWPEFAELDFRRVRRLVDCPIVIDGRNVLDARALRSNGFQYLGIGRR
ncbi:MAG TPA: UDP-glucose/GDP-mannose dehydrogenase family protein [Dehalococcoidia bacterium]|nr:UDP-glucose 6-dehydrogenase [Chloroflexota bacterium]MDP5877693.1 UDP-glucose/GDP-mannose dehydrogenase family protein [Dehalococcoidia bacterium]MDP6273238.1 UDP-glucose/GDP-mannose dehydrogenase family protein [Dehalococcoidia bacterium]MDP7160461.1 UDP-glucose/GDP-mannose dehydrogenase family protein [Dehalococcoidia bacterium]MDP7212120.1 UDP-glucose/GDP-mannose dehydrogenase family protein [Dehalococcoidia bacterium]